VTAAAATETIPASPRRPAMERRLAMRLAADEYDRLVEQLRGLTDDDWSRPTACPAWTVHEMACHILGMAELAASPLEQQRQTGAARERGGLFIDALTALQVDKHRHQTPRTVVERLAVTTRRAARGRRLTPRLMRNRTMGGAQPVDEKGLQTEPWTIGYLTDVVLTRDTWIHRSDIALATSRPMKLTADHDGLIVDDVVREWAQRHGESCTLTLSGPAGGTWRFGDGGPTHELDAELFCRIVSGRARGDGLLTTRVPF
jgi:uncharacterized protein (TIGR03083 family)